MENKYPSKRYLHLDHILSYTNRIKSYVENPSQISLSMAFCLFLNTYSTLQHLGSIPNLFGQLDKCIEKASRFSHSFDFCLKVAKIPAYVSVHLWQILVPAGSGRGTPSSRRNGGAVFSRHCEFNLHRTNRWKRRGWLTDCFTGAKF